MKEQITIQETRDTKSVWDISQHLDVQDRITNDSWGAFPKDVRESHVKLIVENPLNHTFLVLKNGQVGGCFVLDAKGKGLFELHTMLLPLCHGKSGIDAARMALNLVESYPDVRRIESYCPQNHKEVLLFALLCGFKKTAVEFGKWVKNGVPFDLVKVERSVRCT